MKGFAGGTHDSTGAAACGTSSSPPVTSPSIFQDPAPHSRVSTLHTDVTRSTRETRSERSVRSHDTEEKAGDRRSSNASPGDALRESQQNEEEEGDSYSSYYDYDSYDEEDSDSEALNSSHGGSPAPGSPPPQEDLLRFLSYTLEDAALKDHRLMTIEAFRQILLLGTNQGAVAVVDAATGKLKSLLFNHREPISDVDCSVNELYVASSDKAGYVSVQSRRDAKDLWISQMGMPIESIALHPIYHKLDSCPLVCGGGTKVLLLTKGMLWSNSRRVTTLQEGRGRIHRVRWCHRSSIDIVAWLSDQEITLYDMKNESVLRRVVLPNDMPQNALYPPTLRWERTPPMYSGEGGGNAAVLLCGWGDVLQEVRVTSGEARPSDVALDAPVRTAMTPLFQQRGSVTEEAAASVSANSSPPPAPVSLMSAPVAAFLSRPPYTVELRTAKPLRPSCAAFPYRVCGVAPYGPRRYVVLASIVDPDAEGVMKDLEVRVVERDTLLDVYRGRMPVRFIHPLQLHLTYLVPIPPQNAAGTAGSPPLSMSDPLAPLPLTQYFILSVDALVKATPADIDDHLEFLLRTCQFEKAYSYAALHTRELRRHVLQQVGHQWLLHLFETRQSDAGALLKIIELLPELVPQHNSLAWEQWIYRLDTCGESWRLVALLPGRNGASAVYNVGRDGAAAASSTVQATTTPQVPIRREYYDLVLLRCLRHDANLFYAALHKFHSLFTLSVVLRAAESAYREHCGSHAWWSEDDDDDDAKEATEATQRAAHAERALHSSAAVEGSARKTPPPQGESAPNDHGAAAVSMNRTARWSLAASYGYLLRCAGRFEEAMQTLMLLPSSLRSDKELFGLIRSEHLFRKTLQLLPELLQRREDSTLELLMEHAAPPSQQQLLQQQHHGGGGSSQLLLDDGHTAAASSLPAAPVPSAQPLQANQYGTADDPLNVEAVVERLEKSDRLHLLRYLSLLKELYPKRFVQAAMRHAQLVATLYIDYDRSSLLPFLRQMSMYVERIRELHALCHKNNFIEEEIFLLFRMGREEEALRILIEKMHDIHRALEFIVSIPDREEQAALFVRLIDYTVSYNASLPCRRKRHDDEDNEDEEDTYDAAVASGGIRYVLHHTQPGETYSSIAQVYHVSLNDLLKANRASTRGSLSSSSSPSPPLKGSTRGVYALAGGSQGNSKSTSLTEAGQEPSPPTRCIVPLNLFGSLLNALADPQFSEHPALDIRLVLKKLPSDEPIPRAGASIAAIAHTMAEETGFLSTVSEVGEKDLMSYYSRLLKRRTAAIVMGQSVRRVESPGSRSAASGGSGTASAVATTSTGDNSSAVAHRCAACHLLIEQQVVVFGCQHMYHPGCVLQYVKDAANASAGGGAAAAQSAGGSDAATSPEKTAETLRKLAVYCRVCREHAGEPS